MFRKTDLDSDGIELTFSSRMPAVDQALTAFQRRFGGAGALFEASLVLRELINNAVEHGGRTAPDGPESPVSCRIERVGPQRLRVVVADKGEGFSREGMAFDMPADPLTDRNRGLALVHAFAESVTFNDRGNQATVLLRLERESPADGEDAGKDAEEKEMETGRRLKILLVDDAAVARNMERAMLEEIGYEDVTTAGDGAEAVRRLQETPDFDLIISDWNMPNLDGMGFLEWVRSQKEFDDVPFLMATAQGVRRDVDRALAAGASGVLVKPFEPPELAEAIDDVFSKKSVETPDESDGGTPAGRAGQLWIVEEESALQITLASEMDLVARALRSARVFVEGSDPTPFPDFQRVLRELLENAVVHGNRHAPEKLVVCEIARIRDDLFKATVTDEGEGFDHRRAKALASDAPRWEGTRGFGLVRAVCEQIDFNDSGNAATVFIRRPRGTQYDVDAAGDRAVIRPSGNITAASADALKTRLAELVDRGVGRYTFDFERVEEIDSVSLTLFVVLAKMLMKKGMTAELEILNCNDNIRKLFTLTRLDGHYMLM